MNVETATITVERGHYLKPVALDAAGTPVPARRLEPHLLAELRACYAFDLENVARIIRDRLVDIDELLIAAPLAGAPTDVVER